jgi:hypothetical protein
MPWQVGMPWLEVGKYTVARGGKYSTEVTNNSVTVNRFDPVNRMPNLYLSGLIAFRSPDPDRRIFIQ